MKTLADQLEQLAELQKDNLGPVRKLNHAAFDAFERIARKNYELMGDMVEYAVAQSRGQLEPGTPQERVERQMADAKAFAERIGVRASEYAELASTMRDSAIGGGTRAAEEMQATARATAERAADTAARAASATESTQRSVAKKAARASETAASQVVTKKSAAKKTASKKKGVSKKSASKKRSAAKASGKKKAAARGGKRSSRA